MADGREPRDDAGTDEGAIPEHGHDDIVKRLLDYQRQLRESGDAEGAHTATTTITAEAAADELLDLTTAEAEDADTISIDEPTTAAATGRTTGEASDGTAASAHGAADVIVLHPEATPSGTAEAAADVDATVDETIDAAMEEIAAGETEATATDGATPNAIGSATIDDATRARSSEDAERIARYERSLEDLAERFATLRQSFQDMAIAADGRLAEIEELLAQIQLDR
jgi:hypothetical protein